MKNKILFSVLIVVVLYLVFYNSSIYENSVPTFYNNSNKYWAHRVLDPQTANDLSVKFNGVELDVFFESDKSLFDVRHHGSFKGTSLIDYLSKINNNDMYFWIDLKNLNLSNVSSVISRLDIITEEVISKQKIIIESKDIKLLYELKESDYKISYWVPSFKLFKSIYQVYEIRENLEKYTPDAISCSFNNVGFYSNKFPNYSIHCWTNGLDFKDDLSKINKISEINNVRVILVD
jgi:hypothetical protein